LDVYLQDIMCQMVGDPGTPINLEVLLKQYASVDSLLYDPPTPAVQRILRSEMELDIDKFKHGRHCRRTEGHCDEATREGPRIGYHTRS
jgi:hypothetical protein